MQRRGGGGGGSAVAVAKENSLNVLGTRVSLKWLSLVLLVAQNTILVLAMRVSRTQGGQLYLTSTAVVCAEVVKIAISLGCLVNEKGASFGSCLAKELTHKDMIKLALPALLYTVQNNLLFIALSNLQAAVYQITYQLKILTTALMSYLLLGKRLNRFQWVSLGMLTAGVAIVQVATMAPAPVAAAATEAPLPPQRALQDAAPRRQSPFVGMFCVLVACLTSGFAGVYTEKVLKHGRVVSLFVRNIQLAFFSIIMALMGVVVQDLNKVLAGGFFQGYSPLVWFVIFVQAGGGLMIAVVMKYADNILKGFATAVSIVFSSCLSTLLFDFHMSPLFVIGAAVVIAAVFLYGKPIRPKEKSSLTAASIRV